MQRQRSGSQAKVLCVDDDIYLTDLLRYALTREGYLVQVATCGAEALKIVEVDPPDVVLLDVNLPDMNGYELCARLHRGFNIPVIMLTARGTDEDALAGFSQGADDYVSKPFSMQVLMHRVHAVLRRAAVETTVIGRTKRVYQVGPGSFNAEHNHLSWNTLSAKLTVTEGKILLLLLTHEGQVFSPERIIELLWGYDTETNDSVIKTHIRHLRMKIATVLGEVPVLHTVPGIGYTCRQPHEGSERFELT
jgi:two-component system OmpR family response regulator